MAGIALVEFNSNGEVSLQRDGFYYPGHRDLDAAYDWGIPWVYRLKQDFPAT